MTEWTHPTAFSSWRPGDGGCEDRALRRVLASDRLTMGPEVEAFEEELARYHGRRHAIMVNSGSSANLIAVAASRWAPPSYSPVDPISISISSVPAIAWATTYAPVMQLLPSRWSTVRIVDVDDTWNARVDLNFDTHIVMCASILGNPLEDFVLDHELRYPVVIEDNCESIGAKTPGGRLTGTLGHLSTLSFYYSHQISAIEGGAVLTDDDGLARLCRLLRNHGNAGWGSDDFEERYSFVTFGYNLRPLEMHAAVAREQLKHLDEMLEHRRVNHAHFVAAVENLPVRVQRMVGTPSPFGLAFTCEDRDARRRLALALRAEGVDCRLPTGGSFTRHPYGALWRGQPTPSADFIHDAGMFLGAAPWPMEQIIDRTVAIMRGVL